MNNINCFLNFLLRMLRIVLTVACLALVRAAPEAKAMIGCTECVHEMQKLGAVIKHHAPGIEVGILIKQLEDLSQND